MPRISALTIRRKVLPLVLLLFMFFLLFFAPQVTEQLKTSLLLCGQVIIPTLFPYMVLSEILVFCLRETEPPKIVSRISERLLGVPGMALIPFLLGALCGFPIGVKAAVDLRRHGKIDDATLTQTLTFCNNTGPAFAVAGVGMGMFSSAKIGWTLYVIQLISALLCGFLFSFLRFKDPYKKADLAPKITEREPNLIDAIKRSSLSILYVSGTVLFFSALCSTIGHFVKNSVLLSFIYSFLEVSGAASMAASLYATHPLTALLAACIAISFGGASVHIQASVFISDLPVSRKRYLAAKLFQAALSGLFILLLYPFCLLPT